LLKTLANPRWVCAAVLGLEAVKLTGFPSNDHFHNGKMMNQWILEVFSKKQCVASRKKAQEGATCASGAGFRHLQRYS